MNENDQRTISENESAETVEFVLDEIELNPLSSSETIKKTPDEDEDFLTLDIAPPRFLADLNSGDKEPEIAPEVEPEKEIDPIFAALAEPKLPELQRENRARLLMQSPNRLFFYWSMKNNPFQTLGKILNGQESSYQLVAKFVNQKNDYERIVPVEAEGNYWFDAESDAVYQAEIGFYAVNRPYFRIIYSNTVETPRKTPSPRQASEADWAISAAHFAEVLDNSGFTRDAFEVALAGDDESKSKLATHNALATFLGSEDAKFAELNAEEVRFALLALASGVSLDTLRGHVSERLFNLLEENIESINADNALASLQDNFEIFSEEILEEASIGAAVYGASLLNFPKSVRKRAVPRTLASKRKPDDLASRLLSKLSPVSSFKS